MSNMSCYANAKSPIADTETSGRVAGGAESARSGVGAPGSEVNIGADVADSAEAVLQWVVAGLPGDAGLRALQAGIDAGRRVLGNRAFLHWVGAWQGREALQLMAKKKKKQEGEPEGEEKAQAAAAALPGPGGQTQPDPEAPLLQEQSGESSGPGQKKKKKKSRVQVALNTLRGEGIEAFGGYIEAEIGETELLRTLVERIMRAEDLGGIKAEALALAEARMRLLDPEAGPVTVQAAGSVQGQVAEKAVVAPVKSDLNQKEKMLFNCCSIGDMKTLRRLLRYGNIDINIGNRWGTPLCFAAYYGHASIVRELLSRPGRDVNLANEKGGTPLYLAAQRVHVEVVKLLLGARGINVNMATDLGATPLYIAAQLGHVEVVKLLLAVHGINVNSAMSVGKTTPLIIACHLGREDVVRLLLDAPNIGIDARKVDGATALYIAAQENYPRIVEQLVKRGANVNMEMNSGSTPLCEAAYKGHVEVVRILLRAPSIRVDQITKQGITPLAFASQEGHKDIIRLLLRKGAGLNKANQFGDTPLHLACLRGHTGVVEILLHLGADADAHAKVVGAKTKNYTPYGLAELAGHREVMSVLAAHRRRREEDKPGSTTSPASPEAASLPLATAATRAEQTGLTSPEEIESRVTGELGAPGPATAGVATVPPTPVRSGEGVSGADAPSPLAQARDALRQEVLDKLRGDNLKPLEGIRLLEDVNASTDVDGLCTLYNRLAGIERQKERARRRGRRQEMLSVAPGPAAAPVFSLGGRTGLDAEAVEDEIMRHLAQRYRRFVGQAVNDMEFGRGKPTTGYPGIWHASAGIPEVGSCSVFYYLDGSGQQVRIVGVGHHVGPAAYRLDYGADELGGTVLQLMLKKEKKQEGEPEGEEKAQAAAAALPGPGGQTQPDPEAPLPQEQPGEAAGPGQKKKKKKKSRVQVALNTLRGEGVEAFRAYIEAEIGEPELLHALAERVNRAEDLGGIRDEALGVVEGRLGALEAAAGSGMGQVRRSAQEQGAEIAVIATVRSELNQREMILFGCCVSGDVSKVRRLLKHGNVDINMADENGTLLCLAAFFGHAAIVRELLSRPGIDVNLAQSKGATPLFLAVQNGHLEVVKLLLVARGINVNLAALTGATPLCIAAHNGRVEAAGLLLSAPDVRVNARKLNGVTALFAAAQDNHPDIVDLLVKHGADVNLTYDRNNTSPLSIAAKCGYIDIIRLLLQAPGIQVNQTTGDGATTLGIAVQHGRKDVVRLLLRNGADPNIKGIMGICPLHAACLSGNTAIVQMLLHTGVDADAEVTFEGAKTYTPCSLAELGGHREVMSILAAHQRRREQALEDEPGRATPPSARPEVVSLPATMPARQTQAASSTPPVVVESRAVEDMMPAGQATTSPESSGQTESAGGLPPHSPLVQAKDALGQEVLGKLRDDNLEPLEGIRLLEAVNASTDLDGLCALYNRLAGIERLKERARRRGRRQEMLSVAAGPAAPPAPAFSLGERTGLDAEGVEDEIKQHLAQRYHRFVSQAVNNMEFGRGKPTTGFPGLWHVSAGVAGVGSCSVFYYTDGTGEQVRVVGTGHHVGRAAYRLDYAAAELGGAGRVLRID